MHYDTASRIDFELLYINLKKDIIEQRTKEDYDKKIIRKL
jgi:hypothetical protein